MNDWATSKARECMGASDDEILAVGEALLVRAFAIALREERTRNAERVALLEAVNRGHGTVQIDKEQRCGSGCCVLDTETVQEGCPCEPHNALRAFDAQHNPGHELGDDQGRRNDDDASR